MKNKLAVAIHAAIPFFILSQPIQVNAEETIQDDLQTGLELSITANRRVESLDKTLASVSVITRADIEKSQAKDIADVLQSQRGISLSRNGGSGSTTSVFVRGSESDHVLVLLDGVRVSSTNTSAFDWASLALNLVEKIEIVRGPRAALYGSDAIGGVIEITTRRKQGAHLSVTAGKYKTQNISGGLSGGDRTKFSLGFSVEKADTFSSTNEKAGIYTFDDDLDPYQRDSLNLGVSHELNDKIKVGARFFNSKNEADFDQGTTESDLKTLSTYLEAKSTDNWSQKLTLTQSENNVESTFSTFDSSRNELNWQNNVTLSDSTSIILGVNHRQDEGASNNYDEKVKNSALYANVNNRRGALNLDASARYDKHETAGSDVTGQLAVGYDFGKVTAYTSYGTAFKAPSLSDLYYPGFGENLSYAGSEDLEAETSKTFEIGLKSQITPNQRIEVSAFHSNVDNLISYTGENNGAINIDKVKLKGLEVGYSGDANNLDWGLGLSLLRTNDEATDESLIRRPESKVTLDLGYTIATKTRVGLNAELVGTRDDINFASFPSERVELEKYSLLNLSVSHKINKHVSAGIRVDNVTDEDYELAYGYNTAGRGAYLTVNLK